MMSELHAPASWLDRPISVTLVGCGGNGSEVFDILYQFHAAIIASGHPFGLIVNAFDSGDVREPNLIRQRFWPSDVGTNKATALVNRYNLMLGTQWIDRSVLFESCHMKEDIDILITCVDLASTRYTIAKNKECLSAIWLDMGNDARTGQCCLGVLSPDKEEEKCFPNVYHHYPEISSIEDDKSKSCSTVESITKQDVLVNRTIATASMALLWPLLRLGKASLNGVVVSLETCSQCSFPFPSFTDTEY